MPSIVSLECKKSGEVPQMALYHIQLLFNSGLTSSRPLYHLLTHLLMRNKHYREALYYNINRSRLLKAFHAEVCNMFVISSVYKYCGCCRHSTNIFQSTSCGTNFQKFTESTENYLHEAHLSTFRNQGTQHFSLVERQATITVQHYIYYSGSFSGQCVIFINSNTKSRAGK